MAPRGGRTAVIRLDAMVIAATPIVTAAVATPLTYRRTGLIRYRSGL